MSNLPWTLAGLSSLLSVALLGIYVLSSERHTGS
jgi:hypothetical protein